MGPRNKKHKTRRKNVLKKGKTKEASQPLPEPAVRRYTLAPWLLVLCVFLSGAAGLIYEVVWSRQLTLFLGTTAYAHIAVLTAFMAGLAAGSYAIGKLADRITRHLRWYGLMEIAIGVYALVMPLFLILFQKLYLVMTPVIGITGSTSNVFRFVLALLLMLVPTFLMGGTLPMLVKGLTQKLDNLGSNTARLYGLNTLGATLGAFMAGFILIPNLGVRLTIGTGVGLNLIAGLIVMSMAARWQSGTARGRSGEVDEQDTENESKREKSDSVLTPTGARLLLIGFGLSGFAAMQYQVAWIKALILVIGSSVYAFSTTLSVFLAGIALGSFAAARVMRSMPGHRLLKLAAIVQLFLALSALASMALIGKLPLLFMAVYTSGWLNSFMATQYLHFGLSFLVMILPTFMMGMLFPVITRLWTRNAAQLGRGVGIAYASNTFGSILGALLGGVVVLPVLGIHNSVILASAIGVIVSAGYFAMTVNNRAIRVRISYITLPVTCFCLIVLVMPNWNRLLMQSGPYIYADVLKKSYLAGKLQTWLTDKHKLLYYEEGMNGVVSVTNSPNVERTLRINGKADASTSVDLKTQILLGQIPMLIHPNPKQVLVLGMGSGSSAGAVTTHDSLDHLEIVEISPQVVEAARLFQDINERVHDDTRVSIIQADGRNYIESIDKKYDVIISEPSNPWISGISNLFTREFFQAARKRLSPNGLLAQWFHTYSMSKEDLKSLLSTFSNEFRFVSVWMPLMGDLLLIGSNEPTYLDDASINRRFYQPAIHANLAKVKIEDTAVIMNSFLLNNERTRAVARGGELNSDDNPFIEFNAPRYLLKETQYDNLKFLFLDKNEHRNSILVSNMVVDAGKSWLIKSAGLKITPPRKTPQIPDSQWLIVYHMTDESQSVIVKNNVLVEWHDEKSQYRLVSGIYIEQNDTLATKDVLTAYLPNGIEESGNFTLGDGIPAYWAFERNPEQGDLMIGIAWDCKDSENWGYQIVARQFIPGGSVRNQKLALKEFADQLDCLNSAVNYEADSRLLQ